jgi:hypothetical protein
MAGILNRVLVNSRVYVLLCALAGVSPLVGVQGYAWDYPILMFYYFAEAVILTLIGLWKILSCDLKTMPDGSVLALPGGAAKIRKGSFEETVAPMSKGSAVALFFFFSSFGIGFCFVFMHIAFGEQGLGEPLHVIRTQWPLFAAAMAGLLVQHGYRCVSDFWLGPQRNYPAGHFVGRSFFRVYLVVFLLLSVRGIAHFSGSHFALVMAILIGARILVQIAFATVSSLGMFKPTGTGENAMMTPREQPRTFSTIWEVEAFLLEATKDEALAKFLVDVVEHVGRDGYIAVECGGNGSPYEAEYQEEPEVPDPRKPSEIRAECERMRQALALAHSNSERDRIERRIAELAGGICTVRINVGSSNEFSRQKALIIDAWAKFREIVRKTR